MNDIVGPDSSPASRPEMKKIPGKWFAAGFTLSTKWIYRVDVEGIVSPKVDEIALFVKIRMRDGKTMKLGPGVVKLR